MSNSQIVEILKWALIFSVILLFIVIAVLIVKIIKNNIKKYKIEKKKREENADNINSKESVFKSYTKESIYKFMEFDKIEDNMIIQKNGKRFLMVVECQGVNYDLMSKMEKISVEEGFLQFLNSLRHPIQIYVQNRTVNLGSSIEKYEKRVTEYKLQLDKMNAEYVKLKEDSKNTEKDLQKYAYEITKHKNLYEYGKDLIENTKKMNLNKNVLNKKYYIIIPYYSEEANNPDLYKEEIKNMAFSELYTRAQSVIRTLSVSEIKCKILDSNELVDLLYVAYNRDESEIYNIHKAIEEGCEDIFLTAPDVINKRMKELDKIIEEKAMEKAEWALQETKSRKQAELENKEKNIETIIDNMAKEILDQNRKYIGKKATEDSKKIIEESKGKTEVNVDEDKKSKKRAT